MQAICCKAIRKSPVNQAISNNALLMGLAANVQEKMNFEPGMKVKNTKCFATQDIFDRL